MTANLEVLLASLIFITTYVFIVWEKMHRTTVALAGAVLVILLGLVSQEHAVEAIDFNTLGLLVGMMIIVGITRHTGVFQYIAVKAAKWAKGEPVKILFALAAITAVASALLDNVTTVLLVVPVTFSIVEKLKVSPMPFLITEILASNIGGTATLIGDPPNIMISGPAGLGFLDFLINLAPAAIIVYIPTMVVLYYIYRKDMVANEVLRRELMELDEKEQIKDHTLLKKSLFVLALTILGFALHQIFHIESASIALAGATLLMLITNEDPEHILTVVEWPTIFFFIGLFILVGGLEEVGIIEAIAVKALEVTGGDIALTSMSILWLSAIASAFIDNIPFVATMIPLIQEMAQVGGISSVNLDILWWSLALGACLGGNGTLIGASANVIVAGLAAKHGYPILFKEFFKVGFPLMLMSIIIATIYVYLVFLI